MRTDTAVVERCPDTGPYIGYGQMIRLPGKC